MSRFAVLLFGFTVTSLAVAEVGKPSGDFLNRIDTDYRTPHTPLAKPYAGGKLKVLVLAPNAGPAREVVELWQRLDFDFTEVVTYHPQQLRFGADDYYTTKLSGTTEAEKKAEALEKLKGEYDAILVANVWLGPMPPEVRTKLWEKVASGTGLVWAYMTLDGLGAPITQDPDGRGVILRAMDLASLPYFADVAAKQKITAEKLVTAAVQTGTLGSGRVVALNYFVGLWSYYGCFGLTPPDGYDWQAFTRYEHYLSLVGRSLLWAAKREPHFRLSFEGTAYASPSIEEARTLIVPVRVQNASEVGESLKLECVLRDAFDVREWAASRAVSPAPSATQTLELSLPPLPGGRHYLDLYLRGKRGTWDWGTFTIDVRPPVSIKAIALSQESYRPTEQIGGKAILSAPAPRDMRLHVELRDTYGGLIDRGDSIVAVGGDEAALPALLPLRRTSLALRVIASLLDGETRLDKKEVVTYVPYRYRNEFLNVIWGNSQPGILGHYVDIQLHDGRFNALIYRPDLGALDDLYHIYYCWHVPAHTVEGPDGKPFFSFSDPLYRQKSADKIRAAANAAKHSGVWVYNLGDENSMTPDIGTTEADQKHFRSWLAERYKKVEALNARWGTSYKSFDEAEPVTAEEARKTGNVAGYHDHQTHCEFLYADLHHHLARSIKQGDNDALVGAEGSQPGDLETTIDGLEMWSPYGGRQGNALLRSIAPRSLIRGNWYGGYVSQRDPVGLKQLLWGWLFDGNNSLWYFATGPSSEGNLTSGYSHAPHFLWIKDDLARIMNGAGVQLNNSAMVWDGTAILWSRASEHAARIECLNNSFPAAHENLITLLEDLGCQFKYITTKQIEEAGIPGGTRVLFLPCAISLSQKETEAIRSFVKEGGTLVADSLPGDLGDGCMKIARPPLLDLFGVKRTRPLDAEPQLKPLRLEGRYEEQPVSLQLDAALVDDTIALDGGKALGTVGAAPILVIHSYEQGKAILLNFCLKDYSILRRFGRETQYLALFEALLNRSGVPLIPRLLQPDGSRMPATKMVGFRAGEVLLLGIIKDGQAGGASQGVLKLGETRYLYDVLAEKPLGRTDSVNLDLAKARPQLLAVLDHKPTHVEIELPRAFDPRSGIPLLRIGLSGERNGRIVPLSNHTLRVQVFDAAAKERTEHFQTLFLSGTTLSKWLHFPLDAAGKWSVKVTDVLSGVSARKTIYLSGGSQ